MSKLDLEEIEKEYNAYPATSAWTISRRVPALIAEARWLRAVIAADDERLRVAGERVGLPFGSDTDEMMADEILRLRADLAEAADMYAVQTASLRDAVAREERRRALCTEWCTLVADATQDERQRCLGIVKRMEQAAMEYPAPTVAGLADAIRRAIETGTDAR